MISVPDAWRISADNFAEFFTPEPSTGCWLWTMACDRDGYGVYSPGRGAGSKQWRAHRLAWVLFRGPIPDGTQCLHKCDTPGCVNPDHLFLGSHKDNFRDQVAKRRHAFGVRNGRAKLDPSKVKIIRERYARGGISQQKLADEYGVDQFTISQVVRGRLWKEVA